jgi:hypothetical protein
VSARARSRRPTQSHPHSRVASTKRPACPLRSSPTKGKDPDRGISQRHPTWDTRREPAAGPSRAGARLGVPREVAIPYPAPWPNVLAGAFARLAELPPSAHRPPHPAAPTITTRPTRPPPGQDTAHRPATRPRGASAEAPPAPAQPPWPRLTTHRKRLSRTGRPLLTGKAVAVPALAPRARHGNRRRLSYLA